VYAIDRDAIWQTKLDEFQTKFEHLSDSITAFTRLPPRPRSRLSPVPTPCASTSPKLNNNEQNGAQIQALTK
jgi:hypothetical protein